METNAESSASGRGNSAGSKATQFKAGHPGRKGPTDSNTDSRLLRDFRHVYEKDESKDRTPGQKALRMLLTDSPKEFFHQFTSLEKASRAAADGEPGSDAVDEGTQRALDLCETLLDDFHRQDQNAERCSSCGQSQTAQ